jgi:DNA primase
MQSNKLTFKKAKQIPIIEYLARLGIAPAKVHGHDTWYLSPLRSERTPSFKVNTKLNLWYDHGTGEGGSILDLGAKLHKCTLTEFLHRLSANNIPDFSFHRPVKPESDMINRLEVLSAVDISNLDLVAYLQKRRIEPDNGRKYCREVDFRIGERSYKALGFQNRSGGYELRNAWFKGSSSPKDISFLTSGHAKIAVVEGFMDFLSLLQVDSNQVKALRSNSDFLVLNSLALVDRALPLLTGRDEVNLFLDNDAAAANAKLVLKDAGVQAYDRSGLYRQHKDLNEYLVKSAEKDATVSPPITRSRGPKR